MNLLLDIRIIASLLVGLGVLQLVPVVVALVYGEPALPYLLSAAPALAFGLPLVLASEPGEGGASDRRMRPRDGFLVVTGGWWVVSAFAAIPYILTGTLPPVDAFFEAVSGFTTTGSSVLIDLESAQHGILMWRAMTQWLGGMGIIVLTVAVLPFLGIGGMQLFKAEVPGPIADKLRPRIADTARRLWSIYVLFTLLAFIALFVAGMSVFDAICHALSTLATGGFSTRTGSIGAFASPAIEWIVIFFMLVAGTNFVLHYRLLRRRGREVVRDEDLRFYLGLIAGLSLLVALILSQARVEDGGLQEGALRAAAFQVVSLVTTTGFASQDFELWPSLAKFLLINLLIVGGMAGSTAGGLKTLRWLIGLRALRSSVALLTHSRGVRSVRYAGRPVAPSIVSGVLIYFVAYFSIALVGAAVVASAGYDIDTAVSAALTSIGNVGPGLGDVGPSKNFAHFPGYVKLALTVCMVAGRLEIFTLLALLDPHFWRD